MIELAQRFAKTWRAFLFAAAALAAPTQAACQQDPTVQAFLDLRRADQAAPQLQARLQALQRAPGAGAIHVARLAGDVLRETRDGQIVHFALAPNVTVAVRASAVDAEDGRLVWRGEVLGAEPARHATLIVNGDNVTGTIETPDGRVFRLRPLGGGETAIIELNYGTMPQEHP